MQLFNISHLHQQIEENDPVEEELNLKKRKSIPFTLTCQNSQAPIYPCPRALDETQSKVCIWTALVQPVYCSFFSGLLSCCIWICLSYLRGAHRDQSSFHSLLLFRVIWISLFFFPRDRANGQISSCSPFPFHQYLGIACVWKSDLDFHHVVLCFPWVF